MKPTILRSESVQDMQKDNSLLTMKHYHTASLRHLKPARHGPLLEPINPDYAHIPISWEKGGLLFYSEVFLGELKGQKPMEPVRKQKRPNRRPYPRGAGFFHELLEIRVPKVTSGLQDLILKSELGVAPGNLLSEAKLSLAIGCSYEHDCKTLTALKYFKKLFFSAQLSGNQDYEAIALNRLAIVYYNRGNFSKAKSMLRSHLELTPEEFIPNYNMGIVTRCLKETGKSRDHFLRAQEAASLANDEEGQCIVLAQLGLTFKVMGDLPSAEEHFRSAVIAAHPLGASDIEQVTTIALSFVLIFQGEEIKAEKLLFDVMVAASGNRAELCSCNIGILKGNRVAKEFAQRKWEDVD